MGLRPLACWDCGFEFRRGHGCLSLVNVMCRQVEGSGSGRSLFQRSPTKCGVSEYDREASTIRRPWPTRSCYAVGTKIKNKPPSGFLSLQCTLINAKRYEISYRACKMRDKINLLLLPT